MTAGPSLHIARDNTGVDVEAAYEQYWKEFEAGFWETEVRSGRLRHQRSSMFLSHWLIANTGEEILARAKEQSHLMETIRAATTIKLMGREAMNVAAFRGGKYLLTNHPTSDTKTLSF